MKDTHEYQSETELPGPTPVWSVGPEGGFYCIANGYWLWEPGTQTLWVSEGDQPYIVNLTSKPVVGTNYFPWSSSWWNTVVEASWKSDHPEGGIILDVGSSLNLLFMTSSVPLYTDSDIISQCLLLWSIRDHLNTAISENERLWRILPTSHLSTKCPHESYTLILIPYICTTHVIRAVLHISGFSFMSQ